MLCEQRSPSGNDRSWTDDGTTTTPLYKWTDTVWSRHNPALHQYGVALRWDSDADRQWGRYLDKPPHRTRLPRPRPSTARRTRCRRRRHAGGPSRSRQAGPAGSGRWIHADTLAAEKGE
ncbi:hypothetical protein IHE61_21135 [Streptomyces sp. GKU 257-1]|nr:hypothetical protein [Streptomyces sp. GKU 257-1]